MGVYVSFIPHFQQEEKMGEVIGVSEATVREVANAVIIWCSGGSAEPLRLVGYTAVFLS